MNNRSQSLENKKWNYYVHPIGLGWYLTDEYYDQNFQHGKTSTTESTEVHNQGLRKGEQQDSKGNG